MIEKNRDILLKAISDMEPRSPGALGWDSIAGELDHLEASAFAEKAGKQLPGHKAPEGSWEKIAAKLPPAPPPFWAGLTGKIVAGLLIVGTAALAYLFIPAGEEKDPGNTVTNTETLVPAVADLDKEKNVQETGTQETAVVGEAIPPDENVRVPAPVSASATPAIPAAPQDIILPAKEKSNTFILRSENTFFMDPLSMPAINIEGRDVEVFSMRESAVKEHVPPEYYDKNRFRWKYKAGMYYAFRHFPQLEQEGMQVPRDLSSGGLEFMVEKNRWRLKTGLEYSGWKEKGTYLFDYNQNQLIYQYNYVDSAFINTFSGEVTYFTSNREVFDSVPGQLNEQATNQYRMLQVPLLLGYKIINRGHFSLSIMGGVGFDIRLLGKQFTPLFEQEDANVTEIRNSLLYRTGNNWRIIAGLEAGYRFAEHWELYLEPSYQQYMKPFYAPENTKGIGLFKVKAGLHYLF